EVLGRRPSLEGRRRGPSILRGPRYARPPQDDGERCDGLHHFFFPGPGKPPKPGTFPPRPGSEPPRNFGDRPGIVGGNEGAPGLPGKPGGKPPGIFSASFAISSGDGIPPPKPSMLASPAIGPRLAPPMALITSAMVRCIFNSRLTSSTLV